jgi:hypothetical protein
LCNKHRLRLQRNGRLHKLTPAKAVPCSVGGCNLLQRAHGVCSKHLYRLEKYGSVDTVAFHVEKHGKVNHPLYSTWMNMRRRCHAPGATNYELYGGRGVSVCDRWRYSFAAFIADVGEPPAGCTLDRIDYDGDYAPGNVRWATASTQGKNTRTRCDNTSGHKGVSWAGPKRGWRAYVGGGKSRVELGYFADIGAAIDARHRATLDDPDARCCETFVALRRAGAS